ncbi:MAG: phage tail sheath subtilisin-like domain-containing protein [Anaerolineales bacterium]|nr:phage tail sheath subtilisin-like domain-containing protein [Anaerolineales bacterium]
MPEYLTPGVYYERVDAGPGITAVRTDIAGFVGIAPRGPLDTPVPVQSFRQFLSYFGGFSGSGYLAYAVRGFFENGGRRCWVVRVASADGAAPAGAVWQDGSGEPVWRLSAYSPGAWGNALAVRIAETRTAQTVSIPAGSRPEYSAVRTVCGFARFSHVRLTQGATTVYKVLADVDPIENRLIWCRADPESRTVYDGLLSGFNPDRPILIESVDYTVQVAEGGRLSKVYPGVTLVPQHPRYGPLILRNVRVPQPGDAVQVMPSAPEPVVAADLRPAEDIGLGEVRPLGPSGLGKWIPMAGGCDGLNLLSIRDFIGDDFLPGETDEEHLRRKRGLRALEEVDEVAILALPDIHIRAESEPETAPPPACLPDPCLPTPPPRPGIARSAAGKELPPAFGDEGIFQVQSAMVLQCERLRNRIAVLDPPYAASRPDALGVAAVQNWRRRFDSKYAALYYPWLKVVDPLRGSGAPTRDIPPSGHVAGQYAGTDYAVGVHKAPANAPLRWVQALTAETDDAVQGLLNPLGINALRTLGSRGIRIYGARTVSSDPDWRFVNVRRLLIMIEKAIDHSTQWAVFEPNDFTTRTKITLALIGFLYSLWRQCALAGKTAEAAFFVKCDEEINPPEGRDNGRLLALVGVAPAQPFEFVVLRVGRIENAFEITEVTGKGP